MPWSRKFEKMVSSFHSRLVNGPFEDPGLFIPFCHEKRAIMIDLGDIHSLSSRDILKISHIFISHTHMDHFIGFDHMLRIMLGRSKELHIYGPEGLIRQVEGRLSGYSWNLVDNYTNRFCLHVHEVHQDHMRLMTYTLQNRFLSERAPEKRAFAGTLLDEAAISVSAAILDHMIPCLGFSVQEHFHVNIKKNEVAALGLTVGPWLKEFKTALYEQKPPDTQFDVATGTTPGEKRTFTLGVLSEKIAMITKGRKITYITDIGYTGENVEKVRTLAHKADHLYIEAAFSDEERAMAEAKYHLTAGQAGEIAGISNAGQFTLFHFSPRYTGKEQILYDEARKAYEEAKSKEV